MIVIPDLFGAYQKGREEAIAANWQDLANYERIEAARTANDRAALQLLGEQADFNIERSVARDNGDASKMAANLLMEQYPADVYRARNNVISEGVKNRTLKDNRGVLGNIALNQVQTANNNATTNERNSWINSTLSGIRADAVNTHKVPISQSVYNTTKANADVSSYNAGKALDNARAAQRTYETGNEAQALINLNAVAREQAIAPYVPQITVGGANLTTSNQALGQRSNEAASKQFDRYEEDRARVLMQNALARMSNLTQLLSGAQTDNERTAILAQIDDLNAYITTLGGTPQVMSAPVPPATTSSYRFNIPYTPATTPTPSVTDSSLLRGVAVDPTEAEYRE